MPLSLVDLVYLPMLDINKPTDIPITEWDCVSHLKCSLWVYFRPIL